MIPAAFRAPAHVLRSLKLAALMGAVTFGAGLLLAPDRTWAALLVASYLVTVVAAAGAVFVAFEYVTGAVWSVALRRVAEGMAAALPFAGIGVLAVLLFRPSLYGWYGADLHGFKAAWLSLGFVRVRAVVYLISWTLLAAGILRASRCQDQDGDPGHNRRNSRRSAAFLAVFAVTFCLASFDWIMSLEPEWYSTIFGMYNIAGLLLGGQAALTLLVLWLRKVSPLGDFAGDAHLHDLGKLLFGFSTFWMYLWFSQYMLIWYANIPEETGYYVRRLHGAWQSLFILNMLLNWVAPFVVLLRRDAKRSPKVLGSIAVLVLLGRWLDTYIMVMPAVAGTRPVFGPWEVGLMLGAAAVFLLAFLRALSTALIVPLGDPFLADSVRHEQ